MATKKKKASPKSKSKSNRKVDSGNRQIKAIVLFAAAIFMLFVVFIEGKNVWTLLHNFVFGMFGVTAFYYPFLMGFIAIILAIENTEVTKKLTAKAIEVSSFVWLLGACIDVYVKYKSTAFADYIAEAYTKGMAYKNGGVMGAVISKPLDMLFGQTGAAVTIILLMVVFLMIISGSTLISVFKTLTKPVKTVSEQAENAYKARKEKEETVEETAGGEDPKKKIKVLKGFDVDIPVDDIPEKRTRTTDDLDPQQKKVIDTYYGEEVESIPEDESPAAIEDALDIAEAEADYNSDDYASDSEDDSAIIDIDFEKEKGEVAASIEKVPEVKKYKFPPYDLLKPTSSGDAKAVSDEMDTTAARLVETLKTFGVETRIVDITRGPTVTRYELQPKAGVKISKITGLADDIALNLAASGVRIEAPIPNKAAVGIEVPNKTTSIVGIRELIESTAFTASKSKLSVAMGRDIGGNPVVGDISKMPHGLIAGATGSGKSVCINSIIMSILYKATPEEVKLLMIDPKVVELGVYNGIPHLLIPVVTDPRKAAGALGWAVEEMEKRYKMFADRGVRDIEGYNRFVEKLIDEPEVKKMPHIVIIIDELADLMMTAPKEVEDSINRIAAKARAAGMHLLIATQRPSVNVVTGVIKANVPTRIAFAVSSLVDSRTILDAGGAEKLLGRGDMLFSPMGSSKPRRLQGCYVSDEEVEDVVAFVKSGNTADYDDDIMSEIERQSTKDKSKAVGIADDEEDNSGDDPMLDEAIKVVVEIGMASTSLLQRKLKLGYARAARIIDMMEERGVVGPYEGSKPRKVLITKEQLMEREAGAE